MKPSKKITIFCQESGKRFKFSHEAIEVVALWPNPSGWEKTKKNPNWRYFRPSISIPTCNNYDYEINRLSSQPMFIDDQYLLPLETQAEKNIRLKEINQLKWCSHIPENIRSVVRLFPSHQFHLLSFIAYCGKQALDLVISNPALSYMLALNWVFHKPSVKNPLNSAHDLLMPYKNQKNIQEWLNFPPTNAVRNILCNIVHDAINVSGLLSLQKIINRPDILKILSHLERINASILRIVADSDSLKLVTANFLEDICNDRRDDRVPYTAYFLRKFIDTFKLIKLDRKKYPVVDSHTTLIEISRYLDEKVQKNLDQKIDLPFPDPPIERTETIIPLTSGLDLINEGYQQNNCVAQYINNVAIQKQFYIYKILSPERCTLSLKKKNDAWEVDELKKAGNQPVSEATEKIVNFWVASHQQFTRNK
ncbi:MAG: hypothetical protein C4548_00105 [Desulfobacteraceae bacterium]|nr:MAG: hypothetical protein C4548_00105 [Desulfobacteraceae bacterium]